MGKLFLELIFVKVAHEDENAVGGASELRFKIGFKALVELCRQTGGNGAVSVVI